jgi:hypothetical protein
MALTTGVVAVALLVAWLVVIRRNPSIYATLGRALMVAVFAATQQGILLIVHATSHGRIRAGGADIMISAAILAAAAFLAGLLVEDTATAAAVDVEPIARAA